jgi:hypothetical protein
VKRFIVLFLFIAILSTSSADAMNAPKPFKGTASIISGKSHYQLTSGNTQFLFNTPEGWGIGSLSLSANAVSHVELLPISNGYGCSYEIEPYASQEDALSAMQGLKNTFSSTTSRNNGFEVALKSAWFSCQAIDGYLVQIWYSLPKKKKNSETVWNGLKNALTITRLETKTVDNQIDKEPQDNQTVSKETKNDRPLVEGAFGRWVCHHPENKVDVFLNDCFFGTINRDNSNRLYLIEFRDIDGSGYFFIKWDQNDFTDTIPFVEHIQEICDDIQKDHPTQKITSTASYNVRPNNGYGIAQGSPYHIVTVAGDGFLFGFAYNLNNNFRDYDVNKLVQKVSWNVLAP